MTTKFSITHASTTAPSISADADFRGIDDHPGILACNVEAAPGRIAAAVRRIDRYSDDLTNAALNVPGRWV